MAWDRKAPFRNNELQSFPENKPWLDDIEWWDADEPLQLTLDLKTFSRGRSSAVFIWTSRDGRDWPMFLGELSELMIFDTITNGRPSNTRWRVVKRGQNYGLAMAPQPS